MPSARTSPSTRGPREAEGCPWLDGVFAIYRKPGYIHSLVTLSSYGLTLRLFCLFLFLSLAI